MAACLRIQPDGTVQLAQESPASCAGWIVLQPEEYVNYEMLHQASVQPFDVAGAAAIFAFFFSFTVSAWFVAKNAGMIVSAIRRF